MCRVLDPGRDPAQHGDEVDQDPFVVRVVTVRKGLGRHTVLLPNQKQELRPLG